MAKTKAKAKAKAKRGFSKARSRVRSSDAISLLMADHREVQGWFEQFEKTRSLDRKRDLAQKICTALTAHTTIEEEIFYPAFLEATQDESIHHEAEVEHDGAKALIRQIEASRPDDEYFDARVKVLSEMIKHHVNEEEQRGGMFAGARQSEMDLETLGKQMKARKADLLDGMRDGGSQRSRRLAGAAASAGA